MGFRMKVFFKKHRLVFYSGEMPFGLISEQYRCDGGVIRKVGLMGFIRFLFIVELKYVANQSPQWINCHCLLPVFLLSF